MKLNIITKLLAVGVAGTFALATALAQDTSTTTTVTAGGAGVSATTNTSTVDGMGTITTYTPGSDYITFRADASAQPVKYYYTKQTTVVDPDGKVVEWTTLKPDMPVHYTFIKEGDRMILTKVTLEKPISYYEQKETTTTTTTSP